MHVPKNQFHMFFSEYTEIVNQFSQSIPSETNAFTSELFCTWTLRLIFLRILMKEAKFPWDPFQSNSLLGSEVPFCDLLDELCFKVLNYPQSTRQNLHFNHFSQFPYLNHELIKQTEIECNNLNLKVPSEFIQEVWELFSKYEMLIEPTILTRFFEISIKIKRQSLGVYYTSEIIAQFMVQHSLEFLFSKSTSKKLNYLQNLKVCDNACGTGVFLEALAEELLHQYRKITAINTDNLVEQTPSDIKKAILENNLFGVDIDPTAIEIAKWRLWLWFLKENGDQYIDLEHELLPI